MTTAALQRRNTQAIFLCLVATAVLTAADLWSKHWAQGELSRERPGGAHAVCEPDANGYYSMQRLRSGAVVLVDGYLELRYAENCGAAFGMLNESPKWLRVLVFMSAGAIAVGALLFMFVSGTGGKLFAWSVPLIVSGAVGNLVDRVRLGYVVDFIRFHLQEGWEWPTFNVADSTITVGVALLLLDGLLNREPAAKGSSAPATASNSAAR
jgi:signal peptidase II